MRARVHATIVLLLTICAGTLVGGKQTAPKVTRTFTFTYDISLENIPPHARSVRIWIPEAASGPGQTVSVESVEGPVPTVETRDPEYGNRMLYASLSNPEVSTAHFTVNYRVMRREYAGQPEAADSADSASLLRFLRPDKVVPIDGRMKELADGITRGKREPKEVARSIYDYVFKTLRYEKSGTGWGRGDAVWACDAKRGNCTDFHSLFIALIRAEKIPARFEIGFPLPETSAEGEVPGYHCWAEFHVEGQGWIPVDISEAWKTPVRRDFFFGHLDANRVQFSVGRDITLSPRQEGDPLNYFIYPYAEVDGKAHTTVAQRFSYRDLPTP